MKPLEDITHLVKKEKYISLSTLLQIEAEILKVTKNIDDEYDTLGKVFKSIFKKFKEGK